MLLKQDTLRRIASGEVRLAFRRWRRPTVRAGGTLLTSVGLLAIESVAVVTEADLSDDEAEAAGFQDLSALKAELNRRRTGDVYRIAFHFAGPDPRVALRAAVPGAEDLEDIRRSLARWDAASPPGQWTRATLELLAGQPGVRAGDLAASLGLERGRFKSNVRKLKSLGLTESLEVGYRLSPRGEAVLRNLDEARGDP